MASFWRKKKKNPAKRAWKNLTNMVKTKLRDIEVTSLVRDSTVRVLRFISRRLIVPFRTRYLQNSNYTHNYYYSRNQSSRRFLNFFSGPLTKPKRCYYSYDDDYSQINQYQRQKRTSGSKEKVVRRKEEKIEEEEEEVTEIVDSMEDAWRRVVAKSPYLQVNERAEEFIYKFRETMKMEKERSFLEFQERLKRSA